MNDFEQQLADRMNERAERTNITIDPTDVTKPRSKSEHPSSNLWRPRLLVASAAGLLVAGGVVALTQFRTTAPLPAAQQPTPPDPHQGLAREGPSLTDHWHIPYGINVCGEWIELNGDLEDRDAQGQPINEGFLETGIHSHDDGLIHVHPFSSKSTGADATLGTFLANYGVVLDDESMRFPTAQADGIQLSELETGCGDEAGSLAVVVWPDPADPANRVVVTEQLAGTPLGADGIVMAVAFTDDAEVIDMPPSVLDAEANAQIEG